MRRIFFILSIIMFVPLSGIYAQTWGSGNSGSLSSGNAGEVSWETQTIDLGKLKQGVPEHAVFKMKNTGGKPVLIVKAKGTCGCTDIKYSNAPVLPGQTIDVTVEYDAVDYGEFNKTITITLNIETAPQKLHLKGVVK